MEGEVSKQPAPPNVSYPDAPASSISLPRLKPVMTHQQRGSAGEGGREGDGPFSLLKPPRSALNQICSKPRGSPRETKTKIKGPFFFFFLQGPYPLLHSVSPTLLLPLSRAGSRKPPSTLNHEGRRQQSGSRTIKKQKKRAGGRLTLSSHGILDPITREYLRERLRAWQRY